jgi:hypothetical protein
MEMKTIDPILSMQRVNDLIEKMNEVTRELRSVTSEIVRSCGVNDVFVFNDYTSYPYFHDDEIGETEAIIAVRCVDNDILINTKADGEFFTPQMYGRVDYYEICNIILDSTPVKM